MRTREHGVQMPHYFPSEDVLRPLHDFSRLLSLCTTTQLQRQTHLLSTTARRETLVGTDTAEFSTLSSLFVLSDYTCAGEFFIIVTYAVCHLCAFSPLF